jgi:hypothetical protein
MKRRRIMTLNNSDMGTYIILRLNGAWDYELDYDDKGLAEEWFNRKLSKANFILPGTTATNHVGEALEMKAELNRESVRCLRQEFKFVGAAWYQRRVEIPSVWTGKEVFLFLERVMFDSTLWINGQEVGSQDSLSVPHGYNITKYIIGQSECVITLRIDNRDIHNIGPNPSAYTDETQTIWNGAVGRIELFARDKIYLVNVQIYPKISTKSIKVKAEINNSFEKKAQAYLNVKVFDKEGKTVYCSPLSELNYIIDGKNQFVEFICKLDEEIQEWDEFSPEVYNLEVNLEGTLREERYSDTKTITFGMREFKAEGSQFVINNKKTFLRGTLECCIFPLTGFPPTDKASWLEIFTTIKNYGLNHLRFHSWCPPEAAFEAADEKGVYINVEAPMWMDTWTGYAVGSCPEHYSYLPLEAQRIIDTYGNHPSFCMFSNGNELNGDFKLLHDMIVRLKEIDNRRVYTLTTNWDRAADEADDFFVAQTVDGVGIRGQYFLDKLVESTNLDFNNAINLRNTPIVSHEVGQYSVYPDMEEIPEYSGVLKPINFEAIQNDLKSKGMLKYAKDFTMGSGKLAALLYKDEIEAALRTESFGGFQLLDLHDFPGQSTATIGILNSFWKSKGLISESNFREFCSPIVPLLRIDKKIYNNDEQLNGQIQISNFGPVDLKDSTINWEIKFANGDLFAKGDLMGICLPQGTLVKAGEIKALSFETIHKASQLTVTIGIEGTDARNQWQLWVYPKVNDVEESKDIIIATIIDEKVDGYLQQGKKVLLLPEVTKVKEVYAGKFFPVFWSPVHFVSKDPCGLVCKNDHPVFKDFPTDSYASYQWKKLLENSFTMCIDSFPEEFEPIVQIIPNFYNNHRMTNMFEAKVSNGRVLICSMDFTKADTEGKQLFRSIIKYMTSENFIPEMELELEVLKRLFNISGDNVENMKEKDVAMGKRAHSDSEKSEIYSADKGNDGNPTTCWCAADADLGHWWQVDLGEVCEIKGTKVTFAEQANYLYVIKVSDDGENWRLVINETGNTKVDKVREDRFETKCRYVRIIYNGLPSGIWASHSSFQVFG